MKKAFSVLVFLLVLSTWVEAQDFTVKKFVRIEFQSDHWIQSLLQGGCISYTPNSFGSQSLSLSQPDGTTQQHSVNFGQVVFVCGDVVHLPRD